MKPLHRILSFLLVGILLLACEDEQQTWLSEMEGTPDCTVPAVIGKSLPVTITAGGITIPSNVAYTWSAPEFSPTTFTGTTFEATSPVVAGEYYIFITAHSAGYHDVTKKKKIIVLDCIPMQGQLDIAAPAEIIKEEPVQFRAMGITAPTDVTYHWYTDFSPESYTGAVFNVEKAPENPGSYTIIVTAKAENYCDTSFQKTILVKLGRKMQGMFDIITVSSPVIKGQKVTFAARGITTPTAEHITYDWLAMSFTAGTVSGNSYTAICPPTTGAYTVTVTASAPGYADSTVRRQIIVGDALPMTGNVSISVPPEVITAQPATFNVTNNITIPSEGISFVWDAPYFTPSTYQSAGNTFTATPPATQGAYTITVRARAANYSDMTASTTVTVKGGKDMTGELDFNIPPQIVNGLEATFSVSSSPTTDETAPITYEWTALTFAPATFSGSTFSGVPAAVGTRTITLLAKAEGYTTVSKSKQVDVIAGRDMGELNIHASNSTFMAGGDNITFTPQFAPPLTLQNATYTWKATGCTPGMYTGENYKPKLPSTAGTYNIALNVQATGYKEGEASFSYTIACNPMTVGFNLSRTELLVGDKTVLSVIPPSPPVSGISYTWTIPTGFTITDGSSTTPSVTIQAPASNPPIQPVPLTLTAKATNYCEATATATVTVVSCYPATITPPTITAEGVEPDENGIFHVLNLQNVTFSAMPVVSLPPEKSVTYSWTISDPGGKSFTPSISPAAIDNTSFKTKAPVYDNGVTYTVKLQVAAEGYCQFEPVTKKIVVDASAGALTGNVTIKEAVAPDNDKNSPVLWLVKDRPVTLTAIYDGDEDDIDVRYKWTLKKLSAIIGKWDNKETLTYAFSLEESADYTIMVEAYDNLGKTGVKKTYPLTVKYCAAYNLPGLHANINYQCSMDGVYNTAYVIDSMDTGTGHSNIYPVRNLTSKWWFTENLRANKQSNAYTVRLTDYGAYYPGEAVEALGSASGSYCPKGWRIPSAEEWTTLNNTVAPNDSKGAFVKLAINTGVWSSELTNRPTSSSENPVKFNIVPAGYYSNNSLSSTSTLALFMTRDGKECQYGKLGGSDDFGSSDTNTHNLTNGRSYTVRCVND
jgi:uncharacterized protein (TIGR02145 family)